MREDNESLSHTRWNCKYHLVFAPKYRRQIIYGKYKASMERLSEICVSEKESLSMKLMPALIISTC